VLVCIAFTNQYLNRQVHKNILQGNHFTYRKHDEILSRTSRPGSDVGRGVDRERHGYEIDVQTKQIILMSFEILTTRNTGSIGKP